MTRRIGRMAPVLLVPAIALAMTLPSIAATKTIRRTTGDITKGIPDERVASHKIVIGQAGKIKDVNVSLAAEHNEIKDLTFMLQSPGGRIIHLSSGNGASGNGYGSSIESGCESTTTFDDEAAKDVSDYEGVDHVFSGGYKPESWYENNASLGLAELDGTKMKGTWTLIAMDTDEIGSGLLECFKLRIRYEEQ